MTQVPTIYRVLVRTDAHEPERELGTYATKALADQVMQFIFENWDPEDSYRPLAADFRVAEVPVETAMPEFHLWSASIDIGTGEELQVDRLSCPQRTPMEPHWEHLADPVRFVRCPMRFVAGSGRTIEEALANAWDHYEKAVKLGAKDILAKCNEFAVAAQAEAERREREDGPDEAGNLTRAWIVQPHILQELAEAHWGPSPTDLP